MLKATYTGQRSSGSWKKKTRKRSWNLTPILLAVIVLATLGGLYLSIHGPILIHLW